MFRGQVELADVGFFNISYLSYLHIFHPVKKCLSESKSQVSETLEGQANILMRCEYQNINLMLELYLRPDNKP